LLPENQVYLYYLRSLENWKLRETAMLSSIFVSL